MCDFIDQKWGDDALLGMIHSYADRKTTEEAIQANLHESPAAFDKEFVAWLDSRTGNHVEAFCRLEKRNEDRCNRRISKLGSLTM